MNKTFKAKWIKALRSGKYKQTTGQLKNEEGAMCCLGVACDVYDPTLWKENTVYQGTKDDPRSGSLPSDIRKKIGLPRVAETVLWKMNDLDQRSFSEIAAYIEANL